MEEENINNTLALVIVGFEVNSLDEFKNGILGKKFYKDKSFGKFKDGGIIKAPNNMPIQTATYTENPNKLKIGYKLLEQKLIIEQKEYDPAQIQKQDEIIKEILRSILTLVKSVSIKAFGINYSTDVLRKEKLCLFNSEIEKKFGLSFWNSNIGFNTELAFKNDDCVSVYRIHKNEALSNEEKRCYSFNANFDFEMNDDNNAQKIENIFNKNQEYYNMYEETKGKILSLCPTIK